MELINSNTGVFKCAELGHRDFTDGASGQGSAPNAGATEGGARVYTAKQNRALRNLSEA